MFQGKLWLSEYFSFRVRMGMKFSLAAHKAPFNTMVGDCLLLLTGPRRGRPWVLRPNTERKFHREVTSMKKAYSKLVELREAVGMTRKERILQKMRIYSLEGGDLDTMSLTKRRMRGGR